MVTEAIHADLDFWNTAIPTSEVWLIWPLWVSNSTSNATTNLESTKISGYYGFLYSIRYLWSNYGSVRIFRSPKRPSPSNHPSPKHKPNHNPTQNVRLYPEKIHVTQNFASIPKRSDSTLLMRIASQRAKLAKPINSLKSGFRPNPARPNRTKYQTHHQIMTQQTQNLAHDRSYTPRWKVND